MVSYEALQLTGDFSTAIRPKGKNTLIDIDITPNTNKTEITGLDPWRKRIIIRIKERPLQNRANKEIVKFLSGIFGANVKIVSGHKSGKKTVEVPLGPEEVGRGLYESRK